MCVIFVNIVGCLMLNNYLFVSVFCYVGVVYWVLCWGCYVY